MGKYLSIVIKIISAPYDFIWQGIDYKRVSKLYTEQINKNLELSSKVGRLAQRAKNLSEICEDLKEQSEKLTQERDSVFKKYEEQTAINSELEITVEGLTNRLVNITQENEGLKKEKDSLATQITEYQTQSAKYKESIKSSPEYRIEKEAKEKAEKELVERNKLIDFLKAEKTNLIKSASSLLREKAIGTLIEYFKKNFPKQPYVFIDPDTAKIIDYTDEFSKELGVNGNLKGQSYLTILNGKENVDRIRYIRKFLSVKEEKEFDVEYEKGSEKIPLHITKKPPISVDLPSDIKSVYKDDIKTIACVPLLVEKVGKWSMKFHKHSLDEVMEKTEEEMKLAEEAERETSKVHLRLIQYKWGEDKKKNKKTSDKIAEIMDKIGGIPSYLYFKKILYELDAKAEKAAEEEEKIRKAERKRVARGRLKRMKASRRRPKNIVKRLTKIGIDNEKLMELIKNPKIYYQDFRDGCAKLVKEYKKNQKSKTSS